MNTTTLPHTLKPETYFDAGNVNNIDRIAPYVVNERTLPYTLKTEQPFNNTNVDQFAGTTTQIIDDTLLPMVRNQGPNMFQNISTTADQTTAIVTDTELRNTLKGTIDHWDFTNISDTGISGSTVMNARSTSTFKASRPFMNHNISNVNNNGAYLINDVLLPGTQKIEDNHTNMNVHVANTQPMNNQKFETTERTDKSGILRGMTASIESGVHTSYASRDQPLEETKRAINNIDYIPKLSMDGSAAQQHVTHDDLSRDSMRFNDEFDYIPTQSKLVSGIGDNHHTVIFPNTRDPKMITSRNDRHNVSTVNHQQHVIRPGKMTPDKRPEHITSRMLR
jgi:hypothetical protein